MSFRAVQFQDTLEAGGVPVIQARAHARAMQDFDTSEVVSRDHFDSKFDSKMSEVFVRLSEVEAHIKVHVAEVESRMLAKLSDTDKRVAEINAGAGTNLAVTMQKIAETHQKIAELEAKTALGVRRSRRNGAGDSHGHPALSSLGVR